MAITPLNKALLRLLKRAEGIDRQKLVQTFVDIGALATLLGSYDHQVMYGRRGTGKTHALLYLASTATENGHIAAYIDLRHIGSSGGIYNDTSMPLAERATRLICDVLGAVHDELLEAVYEREDVDLSRVGDELDCFADAITEVVVKGDLAIEEEKQTSSAEREEAKLELGLSPTPSLAVSAHGSTGQNSQNRQKISRTGPRVHRVHFGSIQRNLSKVADAIAPNRLWILIDEWSVVPVALQPYLADLIRRAVLPVHNTTVKVAAIEHRTVFQLPGEHGEYTGIELGADMSADINLDDFMVFDNDSDRAVDFFRDLMYRHFRSTADLSKFAAPPNSPRNFVSLAFTQKTPFEDLVEASEGVPRDAINIIAISAQRANNSAISSAHVRAAAKAWYQRDKEASIRENPEARKLLYWIVDKVIAHRRARAFLLRSDTRHRLIDVLFDARVLHLVKRGVSAHDQPGIRYDVYKIDYGCYVDLLTTQRAPQGLLPLDNDDEDASGYVDVPPDDYRAIRRAILDLSEFEKAGPKV